MKPFYRDEPIDVRVNEECMLNAGTYEVVTGPLGGEQRIRPPATTLFRQVLA